MGRTLGRERFDGPGARPSLSRPRYS
jgi:hypothetical protein